MTSSGFATHHNATIVRTENHRVSATPDSEQATVRAERDLVESAPMAAVLPQRGAALDVEQLEGYRRSWRT
jgi:hypothetical protein